MRLALLATSVAAVAVVCAAGASAQAYKAVNRLSVVPLNAADFEVIEARGQGPRGIWCAAADYALHERNVAGAQRIYLKTPRGPSVSGVGRKGVGFTFDSARLSQSPNRSYSVSTRKVGENLTAAHAVQFCRDFQIEALDILLRLKGN